MKQTSYVELKELEDTGELVGYAAVFSNVDRSGEKIVQGAFKNLDEFVRTGAVLIGHDWSGVGVATIDSAEQDGYGLLVKATWLSTEEAQECRKACIERIRRGKQVGMSIGYRVTDDRETKVDGKYVRELLGIELLEVSIVTVPANPKAQVVEAKDLQDRFKLTDHIKHVNTALNELVIRIDGLAELRHRDGKKLGDQTLNDAAELVSVAHKLNEILNNDTRYSESRSSLEELRSKYGK